MQQIVDIELEWWRDAKGYKLVDEPMSEDEEKAPIIIDPPVRTWPSVEFLLGLGIVKDKINLEELRAMPQRIVRLGGDLVPYRPLDIIDDIFRAYINLPLTPKEAPGAILDFVDRYGPLRVSGLDKNKGNDIKSTLLHLQLMNLYIDARLREDTTAIRQALADDEVGYTGIVARLSFDPATRTPKMHFRLPSLDAALWVHLMRSFDGGTAFRRCEWEQCGIVFEAGAGTGRRADSKFCCDQHRIAHHSIHRAARPPIEHPRRRGRPRRVIAP